MNAYNLFGAVQNELHATLLRRRQMELLLTQQNQTLTERLESDSPNSQSNFTCGPVDGSLYATIAKPRVSSSLTSQSSSPAPTSTNLQRTPNHRSLDSGICSSNGEPTQSSPNHSQTPQTPIQSHPLPPSPQPSNHISFIGHHSISGSHQLPPTPAPSRSSTASEHPAVCLAKPTSIDLTAAEQELDQLLESMLIELQSIPDCPFDSNQVKPTSQTTNMPPIQANTPDNQTMDDEQPTSPRFLKRPLPANEPSDKQLNGQPTGQPFSYGVATTSPAIQRRRALSERTEYVTDGHVRSSSAEPPCDRVYENRQLLYTESPAPIGDNSNWLQRQQAKLANRHQGRSMSERRANEQQLLNELRGTVGQKASSESNHSNQSQPIEQQLHVQVSPQQDTTFRTVHTHKRTGVRATSPSPTNVRHSTPAALNTTSSNGTGSLWSPVSVNSTRLSSNGPESPVYASIGTNSPGPTVHHIEVQRHQEQDEVDNLIRTLSSEQHSYSTPIQSTPMKNDNQVNSNRVVVYTPVSPQMHSNNSLHSTPNPKSTEVNNNSIQTTTPNQNAYGLVGRPNVAHNDVTIVPATYLELKQKQLVKEQPMRSHSISINRSTSVPFSPSPSMFAVAGRSNPNSPAPSNAIEDSRSLYANQSQRSSMLSLADSEPMNITSRFYRDTTHLWYRPNMGRDEATRLLKSRPVGSFLVRDSRSFPGSFGLMLRVSQVPNDINQRKSIDPTDDLVRHFLIEPTSKGVRIKGCANEPVFASLSALIYQHTCTPLALPCKLLLPETTDFPAHSTIQRLHSSPARTSTSPIFQTDGAGCNVFYLLTVDVESLTGPHAIKRAVETWLELTHDHERKMAGLLQQVQSSNKDAKEAKSAKNKSKDNKENNKGKAKDKNSKDNNKKTDDNKNESFVRDSAHRSSLLCSRSSPQPIVVYFKVSSKGITLTDNTHRLFFRRHYTAQSISHCGVDTEDRKFTHAESGNISRFFGFVSRVAGNSGHNECHLFAELEQPAAVVISYVNKYVFTQTPVIQS